MSTDDGRPDCRSGITCGEDTFPADSSMLSVSQEEASMELWDEVPEAGQFAAKVVASIGRYKLFEREEFVRFANLILSTSSVDSQGEAVSPRALGAMVREANAKADWTWMGVDHDPLIHPRARILAARLFYAPGSQVHFIGAVAGFHDPTKCLGFRDLGADIASLVRDELPHHAANQSNQVQLIANPHEFNATSIKGLLDCAPGTVSRKLARATRKAADPLAILALSAPMSFLAWFAKRTADKAADEFWSWLVRVFEMIARHRRERVLFEFVSPYRGCRVEFVVDSKDPEVLCEASASMDGAAQSAASLVDRLHEQELKRLVYGFDAGARRWLPRWAVSNSVGVITDAPYLISIDQQTGVSFGGIIPEE